MSERVRARKGAKKKFSIEVAALKTKTREAILCTYVEKVDFLKELLLVVLELPDHCVDDGENDEETESLSAKTRDAPGSLGRKRFDRI